MPLSVWSLSVPIYLKKKNSHLIGLGNSFGMLGGVAEGPLSYAVDYVGWRTTVWSLGILGFALTFILYLSIRKVAVLKKPPAARGGLWARLYCNLKIIGRNPYTWVNGLIALCFLATTIALWAVPFIQAAHHTDRKIAALCVSVFFLGWIIGGPIIGHFSDKMKKRKPMVLMCTFLACILSSIMIFLHQHLPLTAAFIFHVLIGIFSSAQLLNYSIAIEINPKVAKGASIALTNFLVFLGGAIIQPLVGFLIDYHAHFPPLGTTSFTLGDYQFGLSVFPITFALAFLLTLFLKEQPFNEKKLKNLEKLVCKL